MTDLNKPTWSRRHWLGMVSTASATLAAGNATAQPTPGTTDLGARVYNIRDFGAKGDGATLDTPAVQTAIDACTKDQGGTVLVPAGVFVIGTVEIKSNVTLHIAAQGKLMGTADGTQYHAADAIPPSGDTTLNDGNVGLIFAVKAENIVIEGPGTIDGQGLQFRSPSRGTPPPAGITGNKRPYHLLFYQCKNLRVRDIYLVAGAYHSVRVIQSQFSWFTGIHIYNRVIHNNDGFHFISSQYVHVSDCTVICQDDACALFGSCKFVTVTNCTFSTRWSVFRFGGGEAENITVSNCLIYETYGCPIKLRCGPNSRLENISFSNLVMTNVTGPISIGNGEQRRRPPAEGEPPPSLGIVRNISFNGIHAIVVKPVPLPDAFPSAYRPGEILSCIVLNGVGNAVLENISFNDVHVVYPGGGTPDQAAVRDVPHVAGEYFEIGVPPAYGMYARNVRGLTLQDVRFEMASPDARPAVVFDHVIDAAVNGFGAQGRPEAESLLRFIQSQDVLLTAARVLTPAAVFLRVEGADSKNLTVDGGDLSKAASPLALADNAPKDSVKLRDS